MVEQDNTAVGRPRGSIGRIGLGLALASLAAGYATRDNAGASPLPTTLVPQFAVIRIR